MTWSCIKCGEHNTIPPRSLDPMEQEIKFWKDKEDAEDRGENPWNKCTNCRYERIVTYK